MFSLQVIFSDEFTGTKLTTYNQVHSFVIKEAHNIHLSQFLFSFELKFE